MVTVFSSCPWFVSLPDTQHLRTYQGPDGEVALFVAHYLYRREGLEVIANQNNFAGTGRDNQVTRFKQVEVDVVNGRQVFQETLVQTPKGPRLVWPWYEIGGTPTISPIAGKFFGIWHTLRGGSRGASASVLSTADQGLAVNLAGTNAPRTADKAASQGSQ